MTDYDDEDPTCLRTYATLRVYTGAMSPQIVSDTLAIEPTRIWHKGSTETVVPRERNAWFLTSRGAIESRDTRRHIDWIIQCLEGASSLLADVRAAGGNTDIICLWHSAGKAEGGPRLSPPQLQALGELLVPVGWNIYWDK
ncbi:MAG: DUF4279 domain-containing protein [Pseudomonadales bacterium]